MCFFDANACAAVEHHWKELCDAFCSSVGAGVLYIMDGV